MGGGSCWGFCQPEWFNQRVESLPKNGWARAVFCHQESLEFIEANIRIPMPSLKRLENHQTTDPRLWGFQVSMKGKPESNIENWKMMQQNFGFIFFYLRESNMAMENAIFKDYVPIKPPLEDVFLWCLTTVIHRDEHPSRHAPSHCAFLGRQHHWSNVGMQNWLMISARKKLKIDENNCRLTLCYLPNFEK